MKTTLNSLLRPLRTLAKTAANMEGDLEMLLSISDPVLDNRTNPDLRLAKKRVLHLVRELDEVQEALNHLQKNAKYHENIAEYWAKKRYQMR